MKRSNVSDLLSSGDPAGSDKLVYSKRDDGFQTLLNNLGEEEEFEDGMDVGGLGVAGFAGGSLALGEKKRRLCVDQVKALEKNFQVDNKLVPERKLKLAQDLGLQPRQVAVWFQNRRARWKTKQLERDYCVLKAAYEALKLDHDCLKRDHDVLLAKIKEESLGRKQVEEVEEDDDDEEEVEVEVVKNVMLAKTQEEEDGTSLPALKYKDGSSDSDTSVILNEDGSGGISSSPPTPRFQHEQIVFMTEGGAGSFHSYEQQKQEEEEEEEDRKMLEMEEHEFLNGSSNIFSDEQAPTLSWYCSDQWKWNLM